MPERASALNALARKLNSIGHLTEDDQQALEGLPMSVRTLAPDQDIIVEGDRPSQCCILLEGWACRHKNFRDGQRQILSLHMRGDLIDLQSLDMPVMDHTLTALTSVQIASVPHANMRSLLVQKPSLASILWRSTLIEAAITRQWLLNLGQRSAVERIAHLLCETYSRLSGVGLTQEIDGNILFAFPLTQARLGQAMGLSAVHVNRSIQELRSHGLIKLASGYVTILNWSKLQVLADFNPSYLGLERLVQQAA